MIIKSKKEKFYLDNKEIITMCMFAVAVLVFSVLGYRSAFNEIIEGFFNCSFRFCYYWNCFCVPLIMAVVPFIVKNTRKMLITVMSLKVAVTLIGLMFGANPNIHLPVFQDDWGVLFFVAIDIFIAVTVYNERNERMLINGAGMVVLALMAASQIIGFIEGAFVPYYFLRSLSVFLFYRSIYSVIRHITPNYRYLPNSHEMKHIEAKITEINEEKYTDA